MILRRHILLLPLLAGILAAQRPPPPPPIGQDGGRRPPPRDSESGGKWWTNAATVRRLGLTADQQRAIEDVFQQYRVKLIDLTAAVQREEAMLDPLLAADHPQESKVLVQIDRVADARVALEKTNARMLYGFRTVLTTEQWREFREQDRDPRPPRGRDK